MVRRKSAMHKIAKAHPGWYPDIVRLVGQAELENIYLEAPEDEKGSVRQWLFRAKALHLPSCSRLWHVLTERGHDIPPPDDVIHDALDYRAITLARQLRSIMGDEDFSRKLDAETEQARILRANARLTRTGSKPQKRSP